jgi:hypothetical protein
LVASFISGPPSALAPERPRFDTLPGSALPNELRGRGYVVTEIGEGEWILSAAIFTGA